MSNNNVWLRITHNKKFKNRKSFSLKVGHNILALIILCYLEFGCSVCALKLILCNVVMVISNPPLPIDWIRHTIGQGIILDFGF